MKTLLLNFWKIKTILIIVLLLFVSENINGQAACAPNTWVAGGPYTQNVSVVKSNFSGSWKNYKCVFNVSVKK